MSIIIGVFTIAILAIICLSYRLAYLSVPCFVVNEIGGFQFIVEYRWDRNEESDEIHCYEII